MPPALQDWLPEDHLAYFILDVVADLDLSPITSVIQAKDPRGTSPYHPRMMVALLLYAYCVGLPSSRKMERATYEDVAFRVLADGQHPDHSTISEFRRVHLTALASLFLEVLRLCQTAGLVKLGHVALDGTKGKANASRYKAMSYAHMLKAEKELKAEIEALLARAEAADAEEDERFGKGKRGDELPAELRRRQDRLAAIQRARAELEREAAASRAQELRDQAERNRRRADEERSAKKAGAAERRAERAEQQAAALEAEARQPAGGDPPADPEPTGRSSEQEQSQAGESDVAEADRTEVDAPGSDDSRDDAGGSGNSPARELITTAPPSSEGADNGHEADAGAEPPAGGEQPPDADLPRHRVKATVEGKPRPMAQRNFTDPESRIMKKGRDYQQAYNCQAAVDDASQVIVAQAVTNQAPDAEHLVPMLDRIEANCDAVPDRLSADAGYFSESNVDDCEKRGVDPYIAVKRQKKQERAESPPDQAAVDDVAEPGAKAKMDAKLRTPEGRATYARRKAIVEPVFGQIRTCQAFHQFLLRGIDQVRGEWSLYCTGHNLLKLFRATRCGTARPWKKPGGSVPAMPAAV